MNKVNKYWMNFNLFVILVALLALPFLPFAKLKDSPGQVGGSSSSVQPGIVSSVPTGAAVLSSSSTARQAFSDVISSTVLEVDLGNNTSEKTYPDVVMVRNSGTESNQYKVVVLRDENEPNTSTQFNVSATFDSNNSSTVTLAGGQKTSIDVSVKKNGTETTGRFIVLVLGSL